MLSEVLRGERTRVTSGVTIFGDSFLSLLARRCVAHSTLSIQIDTQFLLALFAIKAAVLLDCLAAHPILTVFKLDAVEHLDYQLFLLTIILRTLRSSLLQPGSSKTQSLEVFDQTALLKTEMVLFVRWCAVDAPAGQTRCRPLQNCRLLLCTDKQR